MNRLWHASCLLLLSLELFGQGSYRMAAGMELSQGASFTRIRLAADYVVSNNLTCADLAADTEVLRAYRSVARRASKRLQSRLSPEELAQLQRSVALLRLRCSQPCLNEPPCPSPSSKQLRVVLPLTQNVSDGLLQAAMNLADNLRLAERYGERVRTALGPAHPWAPIGTTTARGIFDGQSSAAGGQACVEGVPAGSILAVASCPLLQSPLTLEDTSSALVPGPAAPGTELVSPRVSARLYSCSKNEDCAKGKVCAPDGFCRSICPALPGDNPRGCPVCICPSGLTCDESDGVCKNVCSGNIAAGIPGCFGGNVCTCPAGTFCDSRDGVCKVDCRDFNFPTNRDCNSKSAPCMCLSDSSTPSYCAVTSSGVGVCKLQCGFGSAQATCNNPNPDLLCSCPPSRPCNDLGTCDFLCPATNRKCPDQCKCRPGTFCSAFGTCKPLCNTSSNRRCNDTANACTCPSGTDCTGGYCKPYCNQNNSGRCEKKECSCNYQEYMHCNKFTGKCFYYESYDPTLEGDLCFPADAKAFVEGVGEVRMDQLEIGDRVLTQNAAGELAFEPVMYFGHQDNHLATVVVLEVAALPSATATSNGTAGTAESGIRTLRASKRHYLPLLARAKDGGLLFEHRHAQDVAPGDQLLLVDGSSGWSGVGQVVSVHRDKVPGRYNPFTECGFIVVDGVLASTHASFVLDSFTPASLRHLLPHIYHAGHAPWRSLYHLLGPQHMATFNRVLLVPIVEVLTAWAKAAGAVMSASAASPLVLLANAACAVPFGMAFLLWVALAGLGWPALLVWLVLLSWVVVRLFWAGRLVMGLGLRLTMWGACAACRAGQAVCWKWGGRLAKPCIPIMRRHLAER